MSSRRHIVSGNTAFQFQKLGLRFTQVAFIYTALDERQMSDADVIVIRKNDIYFDPLWLERDDPRGVSTRHGLDLINAMRSGTQPEFALCGESAVILAFCRRSVYKVPLP